MINWNLLLALSLAGSLFTVGCDKEKPGQREKSTAEKLAEAQRGGPTGRPTPVLDAAAARRNSEQRKEQFEKGAARRLEIYRVMTERIKLQATHGPEKNRERLEMTAKKLETMEKDAQTSLTLLKAAGAENWEKAAMQLNKHLNQMDKLRRLTP